MSTKNSSNNADEEVDKDAYYLDDQEVKTGRVEYRAVIMHTDNGRNTSGLGQFLATETEGGIAQEMALPPSMASNEQIAKAVASLKPLHFNFPRIANRERL